MSITRSAPVAVQVNQILRERIRLGAYPPGGKLPSESELSQEFDVSRATIRTVLARLAAEGLILRKQGDGTYVNERIREVNTHLGGLWEFGRLIESSGYQPSINPLSITQRSSTEHEAHLLAIQPGDEVLAWLGPAIGPQFFEVGEEVYQAFVEQNPEASSAFVPSAKSTGADKKTHWLADLYQLARLRLKNAGVTSVYGGGFCTFEDQERFYSFRRDGKTGRMASMIWLEPPLNE